VSVVLDASVVVAALVDTGPVAAWAESLIVADRLAAPHLMPVEVANILRRLSLAGEVADETCALAHDDLLEMSVELFGYELVGTRVWELRHTLTAYDASYVALAELLDAPLATLDIKLTQAPGPRCRFVTPER